MTITLEKLEDLKVFQKMTEDNPELKITISMEEGKFLVDFYTKGSQKDYEHLFNLLVDRFCDILSPEAVIEALIYYGFTMEDLLEMGFDSQLVVDTYLM